jgi:hypothetical protein
VIRSGWSVGARAAFVWTLLRIPFHSNQWRQRAQQEDKQRGVSSGPKHAVGRRLQIEASSFNYPPIYSRSKDFLMGKFGAIQYQSESDYWSNPDYSQLMDFTTEDRQLLKGGTQRHSSTATKTRTTKPKSAAPPAKSATHKSGQIRVPRSRICPVKFGPCVTTHNERRQSPEAGFLASPKASYAR